MVNDDKLKILKDKLSQLEISKIYKECSELADYLCDMKQDEDIAELVQRYNENCVLYGHSRQYYKPVAYIKMMLTARELCMKFNSLKLTWKKFKSPTEVLGYVILKLTTLCCSWAPKDIKVNEKDPTGEYEIDLQLLDAYGNTILLVDVQGGYHEEEDQEKVDEEKRMYFEKQEIRFVQVSGKELIHQYDKWIDEFALRLNEINH